MRLIPLASLLVLLTAPTCAQAPRDGTYVVHRELPPLPNWAPTERGPIPILRIRGLTCLSQKAWGCFHAHPYRIEIETDSLTREGEWFVLYHELFHVATYVSGIAFNDSSDADTLANAVARERLRERLAGWPR
jgi:hypothetical protein